MLENEMGHTYDLYVAANTAKELVYDVAPTSVPR
jgi:hypothetical protein